jgi:hypothetical protein
MPEARRLVVPVLQYKKWRKMIVVSTSNYKKPQANNIQAAAGALLAV